MARLDGKAKRLRQAPCAGAKARFIHAVLIRARLTRPLKRFQPTFLRMPPFLKRVLHAPRPRLGAPSSPRLAVSPDFTYIALSLIHI